MSARNFKSVVLIGYSGHAFVAYDILLKMNRLVAGYCDWEEKQRNPFNLNYFDHETSDEGLAILKKSDYFICIGNNANRRMITANLKSHGVHAPMIIKHPSAIVSESVDIEPGTMIGAGAIINPLSRVGEGVICNTGAIIEHECILEDYVHIAPGAVLAGNVTVGENSFIGANSVVKQGTTIGANVVVGAGCVVIRDLPDNVTVVGNPQRFIYENEKTSFHHLIGQESYEDILLKKLAYK